MNSLDWFIILIYLSAMIGLSIYLGRGQSDEEDYFVGGRKRLRSTNTAFLYRASEGCTSFPSD